MKEKKKGNRKDYIAKRALIMSASWDSVSSLSRNLLGVPRGPLSTRKRSERKSNNVLSEKKRSEREKPGELREQFHLVEK